MFKDMTIAYLKGGTLGLEGESRTVYAAVMYCLQRGLACAFRKIFAGFPEEVTSVVRELRLDQGVLQVPLRQETFSSTLVVMLEAGFLPPVGILGLFLRTSPSEDEFCRRLEAFGRSDVDIPGPRKNIRVLHDALRIIGRGELPERWNPERVIKSLILAGVNVDQKAIDVAQKNNLPTTCVNLLRAGIAQQ